MIDTISPENTKPSVDSNHRLPLSVVPSGEILSRFKLARNPCFISPVTITSKVIYLVLARFGPFSMSNSFSPGAKTIAGGELLGTSIPSTVVLKWPPSPVIETILPVKKNLALFRAHNLPVTVLPSSDIPGCCILSGLNWPSTVIVYFQFSGLSLSSANIINSFSTGGGELVGSSWAKAKIVIELTNMIKPSAHMPSMCIYL